MSCRRINTKWPSFSVYALLLLCLLAGITSGQQARAQGTGGYPEKIVQWGVQPGETCADISKALYGSAQHIAMVLRYNRVACTKGAPLQPGLTLILPAKVTNIPTARITSVNPQTRARTAGASWATARPGLPLTNNANVNTMKDGRAAIQFRDRTKIYMASNTLVVIYDTASQTAVAKTRPPNVELQEGELQAGLAALRGDDAVVVRVKGGGNVSARSRDAVVAKRGKRTVVSVFDGKALVKNAGASVKVPKNFGTRFVEKKKPEKPRPLPPAPRWDAGGSNVVVFAEAEGATLTASWAEVERAVSYRFEVSRNADFSDLVVRQLVPKDVRRFRGEKMPPGRYFLRVRAIDKDDFLGIASAVRQLRAVTVKWTRGQGEFAANGVAVSRFARVTLGAATDLEFALDDAPFVRVPKQIDFERLQPTKLRVRRRGDDGAVVLPVNYREVTAHVSSAVADGVLAVHAKLAGTEGLNLAEDLKPSARVKWTGGNTELPLTRQDDGRWFASMPAKKDTNYDIDVVDKEGLVLGSARFEAPGDASSAPTPPAPPAPPIPLIGPTLPPIGLHQRTNVMWFAPTPHNQANLSMLVGRRDGVAFQGQVHASGALGPAGFEAMVRTRSGDDGLHGDTSGFLGVRYLAYRLGRGDIELAPSVRVGFPLDADGPAPRLEPGFAVGGNAGDFSWLGNFAVRIRLDDDEDRLYTDQATFSLLFGGTYSPLAWMRINALLDGHTWIREDGRFRQPRGESLMGAGFSLGLEAGAQIFGAFSVRGSYETSLDRESLGSNSFDNDDLVEDTRFGIAGQLAIGVRER